MYTTKTRILDRDMMMVAVPFVRDGAAACMMGITGVSPMMLSDGMVWRPHMWPNSACALDFLVQIDEIVHLVGVSL